VATYLLSLLFENGTGVPQDFKEAVRLLRLSGERGHAEAQFKLGYMYHQGDGVPRDQKKALKWYRRAEKQGHKLAKVSIEFIERNIKTKPLAPSLPPSLMDIINKDPALKKGWEEMEEVRPAEDAYMKGDSKKTFKILKPLAEKGNSYAQNKFARMYELGFFKDIGNKSTDDIHEAVKWYELAAEQGNSESLYNLGNLFYIGKKKPMLHINYVRAAGYFRRAAETEDKISMYVLGKMYHEGTGVIQDYVQAHMWLNISNSKGHKQAIKLRDIIEKKMTKDQIAEAQELARNWKPKK
jgi:TPR repeat protein